MGRGYRPFVVTAGAQQGSAHEATPWEPVPHVPPADRHVLPVGLQVYEGDQDIAKRQPHCERQEGMRPALIVQKPVINRSSGPRDTFTGHRLVTAPGRSRVTWLPKLGGCQSCPPLPSRGAARASATAQSAPLRNHVADGPTTHCTRPRSPWGSACDAACTASPGRWIAEVLGAGFPSTPTGVLGEGGQNADRHGASATRCSRHDARQRLRRAPFGREAPTARARFPYYCTERSEDTPPAGCDTRGNVSGLSKDAPERPLSQCLTEIGFSDLRG